VRPEAYPLPRLSVLVGAPALTRMQLAEIFAVVAWAATGNTCEQMFQFWRRLINQMMHQPVGRTVMDHSLFREQSYHALSRQDAAQRADLGTYRA
jgi:hypothetical protein